MSAARASSQLPGSKKCQATLDKTNAQIFNLLFQNGRLKERTCKSKRHDDKLSSSEL